AAGPGRPHAPLPRRHRRPGVDPPETPVPGRPHRAAGRRRGGCRAARRPVSLRPVAIDLEPAAVQPLTMTGMSLPKYPESPRPGDEPEDIPEWVSPPWMRC